MAQLADMLAFDLQDLHSVPIHPSHTEQRNERVLLIKKIPIKQKHIRPMVVSVKLKQDKRVCS